MTSIARKRMLAAGSAVAALLLATTTHAADPAHKCEAAKNAELGKYAACLGKAKSRLAAGGGVDTTGYADAVGKCQSKFDAIWAQVETKAAGSCPSNGDGGAMRDFVDACASDLEDALAMGIAPPQLVQCYSDLDACGVSLSACEVDLATCQTVNCGDGYADAGEACDGADLNGETCATLTASPYGSLACSGSCTFDTSGCQDRFAIAVGPTVVDNVTGLEWEKKDSIDATIDLGNPHDGDNKYTWSAGGFAADGDVFTDFLGRLNGAYGGACYAGHCDWRLPTLAELQTTASACGTPPCVVDPYLLPVSGGASDEYWSATTDTGTNTLASQLTYFDASTGTTAKTAANFAVAVRTR